MASSTSSKAPPITVLSNRLQTLLTPALAIFTALVVGSLLILLAGRDPILSYKALIEGSLLNPKDLVGTLLKMTPLLLSGLAVGFAFKAGLFNIGAQGQLIMGSVAAAWVGVMATGLPAWLHIILGITVAILAGALWGAIPGFLKAYTEAHEVITTIMFNFIAGRIAEWLISLGSPERDIAPGPLAGTNTSGISRTDEILETAKLPIAFVVPGISEDLHIGFFIALFAAGMVLFLLNRTTFGFELRMVGLNPSAAEYAGVSTKRITVMTMAIAGGLAGLAGGIQTLGVNHSYEANQSLGLGFDSITVSLLAGNHPIGTVFSAFLFSAMDQGTTSMQRTGVAPELILVVQALILMFIAAPQMIRTIYRIRVKTTTGSLIRWGG